VFKKLFTKLNAFFSSPAPSLDQLFFAPIENDEVEYELVPAPSSSLVLVPDPYYYDPIQLRFKEFHEQNPNVYSKLVDLALVAKANGHTQIGISLLWERLRWYHLVETKSDTFKLNNNFRSRYARLIMDNEPALDGFFRLRELA
jgi:hypothetical protein